MSFKHHTRSKVPKNANKVFEGVIFDVYQWPQELFDGSYATFEMVSRADAVSIIPVINGQIAIIHEEQPSRGKNIGFPAGHMEPGEEPLEAAIRELKEETGMTFKTLKLVQVEDIGGHKVDWWAYRFIATDFIEQGPQNLDAGEKIEVEVVDFETAKELASNNLYMSSSIMNQVGSLEDLINFPEYTGILETDNATIAL